MNFLKRVDAFWAWFCENEEQLSRFVEDNGQYSSQEIIAFISQGTDLISEEVHFNVGGDHEFTFAVEGNDYLFYLLPYLVSRQPEEYRKKWRFFPCMQSTHGQEFGFGMYDKVFQISDVMVKPSYNEQRQEFDLRFYEKELCSLEEKKCYNAFYIMMEITIGEGLSRIYIGDAVRADAAEDGMIPLTKLEDFITETLKSAGKELLTRPDQRYSAYQMEPADNEELRFDVMVGNTSCRQLVGEYYDESPETFEQFSSCGAKAAFLSFPYREEDDRSKVLADRHELEDRLEREFFGERGSGRETGLVLGGAMGVCTAYIDLLLYDEEDFLTRSQELLDEYPYLFYYCEFRQHCELIKLFELEG